MIASDQVLQKPISTEQGFEEPSKSNGMLSEILNFFTGTNGSPKSVSYADHIIPRPPVREAQTLSYAECANWIGRRVVIPLIKFRYPQLGTVKYVGCDSRGILCAGIEFDNSIGGMSGKVNGQRLFECKAKHGLLIPVEYVSFLNNYDGPLSPSALDFSSESSSGGSGSMYRTRSVPALNRSLSVKEFEPDTVPGLKINDTVVWLGGLRPMTGVVKWVGRDGRSKSIPLKAWVEMDDHIDYGYDEFDLGFKFGCAKGRGRLLPVDELILLENYLPVESVSSGASSPTSEVNCPVSMDLIDLGRGERMQIDESEVDKPDEVGFRPMNRDPFMHNWENDRTPREGTMAEQFTPRHGASNSSRERIIPIVLETSSSPEPKSKTFTTSPTPIALPIQNQVPVPAPPFSNSIPPVPIGNDCNSQIVPDTNPPPPFIIPPIKISEFFQADGLRGIQGRRNSCYIDVVLFAMFAFSDNFDSYFLELEDPASSLEETELKRICRKVLRENIVNPLRQNFFCPAESVSILRDLLKPLSDKVDGAFMDVEEFMLILFNKVFKLDEFIVYANGVKDFLHQINLGDHNLPNVLTVKRCLEMSMADYQLKMDGLPSPALILEIPRNSEGVIQSTTIVPNLTLDISDLTKNDYKGPTRLNLLAVICIKDYHYVTFVKCGSGALSHWVLFDSNPSEEKPKVEIVPQMGECLESLEYYCKTNNLHEYFTANKHKLPPMVQRLLADMYVCIYSPC